MPSLRPRVPAAPSAVLVRAGRSPARATLAALGVVLLVLLGLVLPVGGQAAHADPSTRYVTTGGSDGSGGVDNDCLDQDDPCATVQHAVDEAESGDTVSIGPGTFDEHVAVSASISVIGAPGAIVENSDQPAIEVEPGAEVTVRDLTLKGQDFYVVENGGTLTLVHVAVGGSPVYQSVRDDGGLTVLASTLDDGLDAYAAVTVVDSTIGRATSNSSGIPQIYVAGSVIEDCVGSSSSFVDEGHNVSTDEGCVSADTSEVVDDLGLGALDDNGGPTPTRLPASDSPVVNTIPPGTTATILGVTYHVCGSGTPGLDTDQRGVTRPIGGSCDAGAVELDHDVPQEITFDAPAGLAYGQQGGAALEASSTSALPVTVESETASVCTVESGTLHVVGAGRCRLTATQSGSETYLPAKPVTVTVDVARAPLTITASDASMVAGGAEPTVTPAYTGLVNGDTAPATPPTCTVDLPSRTTVCSGAKDPNYAIGYAPGELTVDPGPLQVVTSSLPDATVGEAYRARLRASGGADSSYTWSLASGSQLPPGLTLSKDGVVSGTPTEAGTTDFTVSVNDPVTRKLTLTVAPAAAPSSGTSTSPGSTSGDDSGNTSSTETSDGSPTTAVIPAAVQTGGAPPDAGALSDTGFTPYVAFLGLALALAGATLLLGARAHRRRD